MIVAYGMYDRAIGQQGDMPWGLSLRGDLRHFKEITNGKSIIMGRTTYESIGRPLPNRENIVLTSRPDDLAGVTSVRSLEEAYLRANNTPIVIGGAALYLRALEFTDVVFATEVDGYFPKADRFFPALPANFSEVPSSRTQMAPDVPDGLGYEFVTYVRDLEGLIMPKDELQ